MDVLDRSDELLRCGAEVRARSQRLRALAAERREMSRRLIAVAAEIGEVVMHVDGWEPAGGGGRDPHRLTCP
jgi:hypothetical protein